MQLAFRPEAQIDLEEIYTYLFERSPRAATRIRAEIRRQARSLVDHPGLGRPGRITDTRELVIARTPYIVLYLVDLSIDTIVVLRVLHGAQQWPTEIADET